MFAWGSLRGTGERSPHRAPLGCVMPTRDPPTWGGGGSGGVVGGAPAVLSSRPHPPGARLCGRNGLGRPPRAVGGGAGKRRGRGRRMCVSRGQPGNGRTPGGGGGLGLLGRRWSAGWRGGGGAERDCAVGMERDGTPTPPPDGPGTRRCAVVSPPHAGQRARGRWRRRGINSAGLRPGGVGAMPAGGGLKDSSPPPHRTRPALPGAARSDAPPSFLPPRGRLSGRARTPRRSHSREVARGCGGRGHRHPR